MLALPQMLKSTVQMNVVLPSSDANVETDSVSKQALIPLQYNIINCSFRSVMILNVFQ